MNVSLPQHLDEMVRRHVASGAYPSANHVVIEALLLFQEREEVRKLRRGRLLSELAKGVNQADNHQFVDEADVFATLRNKPQTSVI
jgi:putative addiction module CopG family antidote